MAIDRKTSNGVWNRREGVDGELTVSVSASRTATIAVEASSATYDIVGFLGPRDATTRIKVVLFAALTDDTVKSAVSGWSELGVDVASGSVNFEVLESSRG